jgi:hypothetical protein
MRDVPMWVGVTYLIYCVVWMLLSFGSVAYAVFVMGHSGWWFALSALMLSGTYRPGRWAEIVTGDTGPSWKSE